jgi:MFS family permease
MRTVLAIVAGFAVWSVLWLAANTAVTSISPDSFSDAGVTQSPGILLVFLAASLVCSLASGYTAGKIAPGAARRNALLLGVVLLAVGIFVESQYWSLVPLWYHGIFLIALIPVTLAGSRMAACHCAAR